MPESARPSVFTKGNDPVGLDKKSNVVRMRSASRVVVCVVVSRSVDLPRFYSVIMTTLSRSGGGSAFLEWFLRAM